jgi:hypothetical protein
MRTAAKPDGSRSACFLLRCKTSPAGSWLSSR